MGQRAIAARRHRLEHLEMVDAEQAAALAGWAVTASMQPLFDAAWGGPDGMYATRLGGERAAGLNPFAALAAQGVLLAFGSDSPVTPLDPWASVRAAVHHRTPGSGLSARAAFNAHTRGGHRAAGVNDGVTGSLVPGAPAHYAIWDAAELVVAAPDSRVRPALARARIASTRTGHSAAKLPAHRAFGTGLLRRVYFGGLGLAPWRHP